MDYKEFARQMRKNCVKDNNGNIICSAELWEQIASIIENAPTAEALAKHLLENNVIVLPYDLKLPENLWRIMFENDGRAVPVKCKVDKITDYGFTLIHYLDGRKWNYKYTDFGEHIFYSEEETEQAIKEQKLNDWLKGGAE